MRLFILFSTCLLWATQTAAGSLVPNGYCAVVLSSRPSLSTALDDVTARWQAKDITIYKSSNGWYAITSALIPTPSSATYLAREKASGAIPQDALCSAGSRYAQRVTRLAASGSGDIMGPVRASSLSSADQRYVQLGLAFGGHYRGLLDGKWGKLSQRALDQYASKEFSSAPQNWQLAALAFETFTLIENDGWSVFYNDSLKMSYIFPFMASREGNHTDIFNNWEHSRSSLRYSFSRSTVERANAIHEFVYEAHGQTVEPYSVRRNNFAVTSATKRDGTKIYARSLFVDGYWSTVMVSAARKDANIFGAVTSSIADGFAAPITIQDGGRLSSYISETVAFVEREERNREPRSRSVVATPPAPKPPSDVGQRLSSGTGFIVAAKGDIVTNAHVVKDCTQITVDGKPAKISDISKTFDLALLSVETEKAMPFARFSSTPAPLNSDVTVIGFPLSQDLGGLNVTRGSVSAAKGLGGNATNMQITAPIQPGNSGGPVVDRNGSVVGVVVSKLDEQKYAASRGITPQNVNFAIRGEIAKLFLFQNDVVPALADAGAALDPVEIARQAKDYTVLIECR